VGPHREDLKFLHGIENSFAFGIRETWQLLGNYYGVEMVFARDQCDPSTATLANLRPDLTGYFQNALLIKGEEKESSANLKDAIDELIVKSQRCDGRGGGIAGDTINL
jgi:hypothetical protein